MLIKSYQINADRRLTSDNDKLVKMDEVKKEPAVKKDGSSVIYAGDLNLQQDKMALHNIQAQRKALKLVLDTFKTDAGLDDSLRSMEQSVQMYDDEALKNIHERNRINELSSGLEEQYGISKDSQEYEDLQLLRKQSDLSRTGRTGELSDEEKNRLASINNLTDYQKQALEFDNMASEFGSRADSANRVRNIIKVTIADIKRERLKRDPMVGTSQEADEIIADAAKETVGMYMNEVKENIDDKLDEMKETKDKLEEKQKEEEELKSKKEPQANEQNTQNMGNKIEETDSKFDSLHNKIEELGFIKKMLEEDIKGIVVDKLL